MKIINIIDKQYLIEKGLNHVRQMEVFQIHGDHYYPYPDVLKQLYETHDVTTEYLGSADQGVAVSNFTKKSSQQQIREEKENKIKDFEKINNIKILKWE